VEASLLGLSPTGREHADADGYTIQVWAVRHTGDAFRQAKPAPPAKALFGGG
jgi:hypothetical protein